VYLWLVSLLILGKGLAFSETNAFDKAARLFGFGIGGGEIFPEGFAVIRVADVVQLMGDDVVYDPLRPAANFIADADVARGDAAACAAAQSMLHVAGPVDGLPLDLVFEKCAVYVECARLQVGIGAAYPAFGTPAKLLADIFQQRGDVAFEVALRDAQ